MTDYAVLWQFKHCKMETKEKEAPPVEQTGKTDNDAIV